MTAQAADWKAQAQEKRNDLMESITDAIKALAAETDAVRAGEALARYFDTLSKFHRYSLHNQILIWLQKPDATLVAGFQTGKQKFSFSTRCGAVSTICARHSIALRAMVIATFSLFGLRTKSHIDPPGAR